MARIWPLDPLPLAVARKPRALTDDERARFQVEGRPGNKRPTISCRGPLERP